MRKALAFAVALLGAVGNASAQTLDTAQLRRRADSLLVLWQEANLFASVQANLREDRQRQTAQVTRRTAAVRDEHPVQAGGLMVIASEPDSIPLRAAVPLAWAALRRAYGSRADSLARQPVRFIVINSDHEPMTNANVRRVPAHIAPEVLERMILAQVGSPRPDARLSRWMGGAVHVQLDTTRGRADTYLELVTGGLAARACFTGDLARCGDALELHEDTAFYLTVFNAADRREAVAKSRQPSMLDQVARPRYTQCVTGGDDSSCIAFMRGMGVDQVPRPLDGNGRESLLLTAFDLGGDSAYDRLMADTTASVIQRLEHAANAPIATIVARWRREVLAARPPTPAVPVRDALLSFGWVALLATGAARSTRWRLG